MSAPPIPTAVILRTEHLGRTVKDKILVQDATFELRKGEVLAITGPSGSGKTSLLRLLNRLDEPTSGTVMSRTSTIAISSRENSAESSDWSHSVHFCFRAR